MFFFYEKKNLFFFERKSLASCKTLQMATPKVGLFGTSLILGSKNLKISRFQNAVKIALVNEFHQNLHQMEDLGPYFYFLGKKIIFYNFFMILCTFEHGPDLKLRILSKISKMIGFWKLIT